MVLKILINHNGRCPINPVCLRIDYFYTE
uniref:Uncharacterized protein n=1 Tax=Anguilla anguilla TaxID=7936 RepID=A0A0E9PBP0_ANGAN